MVRAPQLYPLILTRKFAFGILEQTVLQMIYYFQGKLLLLIYQKVTFFDGHSKRFIYKIIFLPVDCKYLVACVRDDTIKLVDLRRNQVVATFSHDNFKVGCDWSRICFSPDSSKVSAGGSDGSIYIWNVNGQFETVLKDHT